MTAELLFFEGCPHGPPALERLRAVLGRLAPGTDILEVCVEVRDELGKRLRRLFAAVGADQSGAHR